MRKAVLSGALFVLLSVSASPANAEGFPSPGKPDDCAAIPDDRERLSCCEAKAGSLHCDATTERSYLSRI